MKISCCEEMADAVMDAYKNVLDQKLQEYLNDTGLRFRSKYMVTGIWAEDILKQMSLFMRVAGQVKEWEVDYKEESQVSWDVFKQEIVPALDYTENEDDEQKYDLLCDLLMYIYNSLARKGYEVVRECSR